MKTHLLYSTTAALAIIGAAGVSSHAHAQVNPEPQDSSSANTGATADVKNSEVIVTARRRDERLQDVPIAVSAIGGEQAERLGVDDTDSLVIMTPSLDFGRQSSFGAIPYLRGVGTSFAASGVEAAVAIYVDDVYIASPNANMMELDNIESVQVLKGPQGTLFGRNATGGVIQVKTKDPSFTTEGKISAGYGNYDTYSGSAYLNAPLGDKVAINLAASGSKQADGFGKSVLNGKDVGRSWDWNVRGKMLFDLTDTTSILLSGDYSEMRSDKGGSPTVFPGTVSLFGSATFVGAFNTATDGREFTKVTQAGGSLTIKHEASFADIVSISAYRDVKQHSIIDQDAGPIPVLELDLTGDTKTFSQELRLASNGDGPFQWVVGGYYFRSVADYAPATLSGLVIDVRSDPTTPFYNPANIPDPTSSFSFTDTQKLNSYSGFAEGTYEFIENTHITLGVRYTKDKFKLNNEGFVFTVPGLPVFTLPGTVYKVGDSFSKVTYRAILDHKFTPDILGYASYSRGFKSGGYNLPEPGLHDPDGIFYPNKPVVKPVEPEVLDAFEIGLKTTLFNGAMTFNAAAYYYSYKNLIVGVNQATSIIQRNAAKAEIKGIDVDFIVRPADGFQIAGGVGYVDSEYKKFPNGPTFTPTVGFPFGNTVGSADLAGNRTQRAPKFTLSLAPSYTARAGNGEITFAASFYHNSGYFSDPENRLRQPSYDLVNASVGYEWDSGLGVRGWVKNLLDTRYFAFLQADPFKDAQAYADPQTYGVTIWKKF